MCNSVLDYIRKEKAHKQVVLVLNKCDLVPAWVTVRISFHTLPFLFPVTSFLPTINRALPGGMRGYSRGRTNTPTSVKANIVVLIHSSVMHLSNS